jgi:hypothetical protein
MMKKLTIIVSFFLSIVFIGCSGKSPEYATVDVGGKDGLVHNSNGVVVKPIFKRIDHLQGVEKNYQHPNYLNIHWFHNNGEKRYAVVENTSGKLGIIDTKGNMLAKPIYDSISLEFNGFIKVEVGEKFGLLDDNFEVVLKPIFTDIEEFVYDTAVVEYKGKYGCIDRQMNMKLKPEYDRIYLLDQKIRRVEIDNKWGFTDGQCNMIVKPSFEYLGGFSNGVAKYKSANRWGYIKTDGELLTKNIFEDADTF